MLELTWFALWGILWAVYFALDGFDLGLGMLIPFLARDEKEKRVVYRAMGPFWDGNEVWLIAAGGVTFAAFPAAYATLFSALYAPLMFVLFALILRAVSIEFREQLPHVAWKSFWDACLVVSSLTASFLFGVIFANLFAGIPIGKEGVFQDTVLALFNPYGLAGGVFFTVMFLVHGMLWLIIKSEGGFRSRVSGAVFRMWGALFVAALTFIAMSARVTDLFDNYLQRPALFLLPAAAVGALAAIPFFVRTGSWWKAWFSSFAFIAGFTLFGVAGMYPNLIYSSINTAYSITISGAASSPLALKIMLVVALVFVPLVICYQAWVYWLFRDAIDDEDAADHYY